VAREPIDRLAAELSALLSEIDAAIPARLQEPPPLGGRRRREEPQGRLDRMRGAFTSAMRWLRRGS
jgi:hypothetical protein